MSYLEKLLGAWHELFIVNADILDFERDAEKDWDSDEGAALEAREENVCGNIKTVQEDILNKSRICDADDFYELENLIEDEFKAEIFMQSLLVRAAICLDSDDPIGALFIKEEIERLSQKV